MFSVKQVAEFKGVTFDEVDDNMKLIEFFNILAYLKAYNKHMENVNNKILKNGQ